MSFLGWVAICGGLLLLMAFSSAALRRLPISSAIVYLLVGVALGPLGFGWLRVQVGGATPWLERLTEVALIISLFIGGLKLRAPLRHPSWRAAYLLAGPVMLACIAGVAAFAHLGLGLALAPALLLGAVLAPTDPVLASALGVEDASDRDRLRHGLSGEAGLNDGMAFPFVVFALMWAERGGPGGWIAGWALHRLLWAVPVALFLGFLAGLAVGRVAIRLRRRQQADAALNDLLTLALIALAYALAQAIGAWGFLAAFAAGVGLRRAEVKVVENDPHPEAAQAAQRGGPDRAPDEPLHPPAEDLVPAGRRADDIDQPAVAAGVLVADALSFGDTAERLLEVALIVLLGVCLVESWDVRALPLALFLFVVLRPLATGLFLAGSPTGRPQRLLMGWFGIRGVGSLYYLTYALREAGPAAGAPEIVGLTLTTVAMSIVIHGASSTPLLRWYRRSLSRR